jgi:hopanoid biosynthesis associated protein HpnK
VLTSASLMVTGEAVEGAVRLAKKMPSLGVGLHLVVVKGRAALPAKDIPQLVDVRGCFSNNSVQAGLRYFFSKRAQEQLSREIEAQFERFAASRLPLCHVDGHLHMHLHPSIFDRLLSMAEAYGARGLRLPRDDFWMALGYSRRSLGSKSSWAIIFSFLCRWALRRLSGHRLAVAGRVYGLMQSGQMEEAYVLRLIEQMKPPHAEIFFHPSTRYEGNPFGPNPGDLATLLSPAVREALQAGNWRLGTYADLVGTA